MLKVLAVLFLFTCSKQPVNPLPQDKYAVIQAPSGLQYHTGLLHVAGEKELPKTYMQLGDCENLPESFDLRDLNVVPDVRDQGACGSCWSFSKTGSLESALLNVGKNFDLSEQELVSNDKSQWGCQGGLLTGFKYQIDHGQGLEKDFGYTSGKTGRNGSSKSIPVAAKGISYEYVGSSNSSPTEKQLKCALFTSRTIPWITVSASNAWGSPPSSEKTMYTRCGGGQTNHAVGVTGWHKDEKTGRVAFHMKNSWGKGWGDQGYMSLPLGCDSFGDEVAFIKIAKPDPTPVPPSPSPEPTAVPTPNPTPAPVDECKEAYKKVGECLKLKNIFGVDDSCWKAYAKLVQCLEKAGN